MTPGFIDIHSHYDAQVFWDPALTPSSFHGVTSVVAGNCGFSIAPCRPEHRELLARTLQHVEDMDLATLEAGIPWDFETFPEYLDSVGPSRHRAQLRRATSGTPRCVSSSWARRATSASCRPTTRSRRCRQVVREAMEAGAMGFATSSSATHNGDGGRPVPSRLADRAELEALLAAAARRGKGVAALLPGEKIKHADVHEIQAAIGRPLTWTALLTIKGFPWHEDIIKANDEARSHGGQVWPQISVRPLVFQMNLREPFTFNMAPAFAALMAEPDAVRHRAVRGPGVARARAGRPRTTRRSSARTGTRSRSPRAPRTPSSSTGASSRSPRSGACTALDVMLDTSLDENLETRFRSMLANNDPDAIAWLLRPEGVLLGLADSGAHVSQLCDACLPTDLLGNWVREKEVISLERAVNKLTGEPAAGLRPRPPRPAVAACCARAWPRTSPSSTPPPSRPARCGGSATSPPTASASPPTRRAA